MAVRRTIAVALLFLLAAPGWAADSSRARGALVPDALGRVGDGVLTPPGAPRLVVVLVFDQFHDDFLDHFRHAFGSGGFLRLVGEGARFTDCTIPYAATLT